MKICLVMIVKNESAVLDRSLKSAAAFCDYALICDTGSSDDEFYTQDDIIRTYYEETNFKLIHRPWVNFASNRTMALRAAEQHFPDADFLFMLDADDYVTEFDKDSLDLLRAGYFVRMKQESIEFPRIQLFRVGRGWHYVGVVHEYPERTGSGNIGTARATVVSTRDGARSLDPDKYRKDAALLEAAIVGNEEPDLLPRYQFYLAQSYRDAGDYEQALWWYAVRSDNPAGYVEEQYVSLFEMARCGVKLGHDVDRIVELCRAAQRICPQRREAAHFAIRLLRANERYSDAVALLEAYPPCTAPESGLFLQPDVYRWRLHDEAAVCAYYVGDYVASLNQAVLSCEAYPDKSVDMLRLTANVRFALDKL